MRMMINFFEEKVRRLRFDNWNEEDEQDATKRQLRYLTEMSKGTPVIMQVFQENLELKYAIENSLPDEQDAFKNFSNNEKLEELSKNGAKATLDRLDSNIRILAEVLNKIEESVRARKLLSMKFEKLCMWKGMSAEDIRKAENSALDFKNELNNKIEKLNLELTQAHQRELEKDREIQFEKNRVVDFKAEIEKIQKEHTLHVQNYESRIDDLKGQYENKQTLQTHSSTTNEIEENVKS